MTETQPLNVRQLLHLLRNYLPLIGASEAAGKLTVHKQGEGQFTVMLGSTGVGIDTGHEMKVKSLDGPKRVLGYRAFVMVCHPATRNSPGEEEDVTTVESISMGDVLEEAGRLLAKQALDALPDLPADLQEPQMICEAAW